MNHTLHAWLDDTSWSTALWLDDHDRLRTAARYWHHRTPRTIPSLAPAAVVLPFTAHPLMALPAILAMALLHILATHLADRTHAIGQEDATAPCSRCPQHGSDDDGRGGTGPDDNPGDGPLDPFTADDMAMFDALYLREATA